MNFPRIQAVPHPSKLSFQLDGKEILAYQYANVPSRPFLFPAIGPSGRYITRIGHPHDPIGHRHHYSIWLGHHNINEVDFWSDNGGKQVHQGFLKFEDDVNFSSMTARVYWQTSEGKQLLEERKQIAVRLLENREYLIDINLTFEALENTVTFAKTNFGFLGVRVAKTMTTNDGGGRITNSAGAINEDQIFGKRARWCDYSGPVIPTEWNGITIFDHPDNANHPTNWHVRGDGWACPSLFFEKALTLPVGQKLSAKYRLFVHAGEADVPAIEAEYEKYIGYYKG